MSQKNVKLQTLYEDKDVHINEREVKIKCYYFPTTQSKTIPFTKIKNIEFGSLSLLGGKGRIWGMSIGKMGYWFAGDLSRMQRENYIAIDTGSKITPTFTTQKDHHVYQLLYKLWKQSQKNPSQSECKNEEEEMKMA